VVSSRLLYKAQKYCDVTPESRNSPLLSNGWISTFHGNEEDREKKQEMFEVMLCILVA
jgi:hypothetical protein